MQRLPIPLLFISFFAISLGCSASQNANDDLIPATTKLSMTSTSISQNLQLATTTQFDYTRLDYSEDAPDFLYEAADSSKLSTDWRDALLSELRLDSPNFDAPYVREEWGPG